MTTARRTEQEELEAALALSLQQQSPRQDDDDELRRALALSLATESASGGCAVCGGAADSATAALLAVIFGETSPAVAQQWLGQGISFAAAPAASGDGDAPAFTAGLAQNQGGPCAVLAAAQAFTLRRLLFDPEPRARKLQGAQSWLGEASEEALAAPSEAAAEALLCGLTDILWQAAVAPSGAEGVPPPRGVSVVALAEEAAEAAPETADPPPLHEAVGAIAGAAAEARSWEETRALLSARASRLRGGSGALGFLCSVLLTRGLALVAAERDDGEAPLLDPTFGHCAQEALSLMLTGAAAQRLLEWREEPGGRSLSPGPACGAAVGRPPIRRREEPRRRLRAARHPRDAARRPSL
ncbi:hypothetical protein EMIHUDRAFT_350242 [Emiliania huxleyi CCMP1516]|uniref:Deubiquitinating enzyme MINDY-3/4 conserved domain-containing protein n=2 Tax=Emiliania huxleyi TaxID=2903 RepID=A0A0D3ITT4_EMIH1|nr:hypothetical protein EMIHUDRAFT_350242 [Emiliania huxleyi CCMP1516]EOD14669.1 hypothetical protein EMIHUDRAFT_350242 [Emiliania huxleyi CCMP1516]|eukprot:XP_005767098.1 hypothetical protein EMIHUDRAFT_350242 [Emiliania huxleyi CCMP1516]